MADGESKSPFQLDSVKLRSLYKDGADMVEDRRAELMSWFKDFGLATVVDEDGFTVTKVGDPPSRSNGATLPSRGTMVETVCSRF